MAEDAELVRLREARDQARMRREAAVRARDDIEKRYHIARDEWRKAFAVKRAAQEEQARTWTEYEKLRNPSNRHFNWIDEVQKKIRKEASIEDDAPAPPTDAEVKRLKEEVDEARRAHQQARSDLWYAKNDFLAKQIVFRSARQAFDDAKVEVGRTKSEHARALEAFQARLRNRAIS